MQGYIELVNGNPNWRDIGEWIPTALYEASMLRSTNAHHVQSLWARAHAWALHCTLDNMLA